MNVNNIFYNLWLGNIVSRLFRNYLIILSRNPKDKLGLFIPFGLSKSNQLKISKVLASFYLFFTNIINHVTALNSLSLDLIIVYPSLRFCNNQFLLNIS